MTRPDEIGYWTELKLDIIRKYAAAYSAILSRQSRIRSHLYIDAFAGSGRHLSKRTKKLVAGSPMIALDIEPPFREFHFIDLDGEKASDLRQLAAKRPEVVVHEGDCNTILLEKVFPSCRYEDYQRALCLLDPYQLRVDWTVL